MILLFFFVLALWCYSHYASTRAPAQFVGALIAANIALYYKEPGFLMLGVFATARLAFTRKGADRSTRMLDLLLLASALLFVIVYYAFVYRYHHSSNLYGVMPFSALIVAMRNLGDYAASDPLIVLVLPAIALWRLHRVAAHGVAIEPVADALLLGALAYIPIFFVLKLFAAPHYLLPAYAFAVPALLGYWRHRGPSERLLWNIVAGVLLFFTVTGAAPLAFHLASFNKYVPRNYAAAITFLTKDIAAHPNGASVIYLDGVDSDRAREIYVSLNRYLVAAGIAPRKFTIRHLSDWRDARPTVGDYLVITPFDTENSDAEQINAVERSWKLAWHSESPLAVPDVSLKVLLKYVALNYVFPKGGATIGASNSYIYPVDYEIFVK